MLSRDGVKNICLSVGSVLFSAALIGAPLMANAADVTTSNDTTGANSTNSNTSNISNSNNATVTQNATVNNNFNFSISTGNNTVKDNTTVGNIQTGNVSPTIAVDNDLNTGKIIIPTFTNDPTVSTSNSTTGPDSINKNTTSITNFSSSTISQISNIKNCISANINTGGNTFSNNTKLGNITLGNVNLKVSVDNTANGPADGKGGGNTPPPSNGGGSGITNAVALYSPASIVPASATFFPSGGSSAAPLIAILSLLALAILPTLARKITQLFEGRPAYGEGLVPSAVTLESQV